MPHVGPRAGSPDRRCTPIACIDCLERGAGLQSPAVGAWEAGDVAWRRERPCAAASARSALFRSGSPSTPSTHHPAQWLTPRWVVGWLCQSIMAASALQQLGRARTWLGVQRRAACKRWQRQPAINQRHGLACASAGLPQPAGGAQRGRAPAASPPVPASPRRTHPRLLPPPPPGPTAACLPPPRLPAAASRGCLQGGRQEGRGPAGRVGHGRRRVLQPGGGGPQRRHGAAGEGGGGCCCCSPWRGWAGRGVCAGAAVQAPREAAAAVRCRGLGALVAACSCARSKRRRRRRSWRRLPAARR